MQSLHDNPPAPFNQDFRAGFGDAVSKAHAIWCEANPNVTRPVRAAAYLDTSNRLKPQFPSVRELQEN